MTHIDHPTGDRRAFLKGLTFGAAGFGLAAAAGRAEAQAPAPDTASASGAYTLNVRDYGAAGDGTTDDTAAFQAALDAAGAAGGGVVFAPTGSYAILGNLTVRQYVTLEGVFRAPQAFSQYHGTTLLATAGRGDASGTPFITLEGCNSGLKGLTIFYPDQNDPTNIVPYPWTVRGGNGVGLNDNRFLLDCLLVNPYQAVDFGTYPSGRHYIRGLYGQPLSVGILVDQCLDIGRIEDVHFWPFWSEQACPHMANVAGNARAMVLKRADWQIVHNFFSFGYHVGIQFLASTDPNFPGPANGHFSNINMDACNVGLDIYASSYSGLAFSNLNQVCSGQYGQDLRIGILRHNTNPGNSPVSIVNASFWGSYANEVIRWETGGPLTLTGCSFRDWGRGGPAVTVSGGRATITGCFFEDAVGQSVSVTSDDRVIVQGNQLVGNPILVGGQVVADSITPTLHSPFILTGSNL